MDKNCQNNTSATAKQLVDSPASTDKTIGPITIKSTQINNQKKLPKDVDNIKGEYDWAIIAGFRLPYIIRIVNGEHLKFVSSRMAEKQLLKNYLQCLHPDIVSCASVKGHVITDSEAKIFNHINEKYYAYRKDVQYFAGKDYVVRLEDIHQFYIFLEICYKKILCNETSGYKDKCGFMQIKSSNISLAYCTQDGQKYIPLFFFDGDFEKLRHLVVKLENCNLAYLKFCCKLQGIRNELFDKDYLMVISFNDFKKLSPPKTNFQDFWPVEYDYYFYLLNNQKSTHGNLPSPWFIASPQEVPDEYAIPHTSTVPAPVIPQSVQMQQHQKQQEQQKQINTTSLIQALDNLNIDEYKVQKVTLQGKTIHCINTKPYMYSDWMVTLKDIVQMVLPPCTVAKCAHILLKYLKTTLIFGNSEQLTVLRDNGLIKSINPGDTPMAMLQDIMQVLPQLQTCVLMNDREIEQYQSAGGSSK